MEEPRKVSRALVSLSDKEGAVELCKALEALGVEILSTGGTAGLLADNGVAVTQVSDVTGFPEILDGRVKALHPMIHGGILARRGDPQHEAALAEHGIRPIDLVVVNLYPFETTIVKTGVTVEEAVEQIDIGGPCMIRAAAKNFRDVAVVVDPGDYGAIRKELEANDGCLSLPTRLGLAHKAFRHTARYDAVITAYMSKQLDGADPAEEEPFPERTTLNLELVQSLRYGENPHQRAALYRDASEAGLTPSLIEADQLQGKELSFNNLVDLEAALLCVQEFEQPACVIIKHTNPCGVGIGDDAADAYQKAHDCDPTSAYGGVLGFNRPVDGGLAEALSKTFVEAVVAPGYSDEALEALEKKKALRLLRCPGLGEGQDSASRAWDIKKLIGGALLQDRDAIDLVSDQLTVPTKRQPTDEEMSALRFAWRVAKHVKSNAIVYTRSDRTVGIGAGQMSRVDSVRIAAEKAQSDLAGCVMASDAFFPFRDSIDEAAARGITAVIQPGGSIRDEEVIAACNEHDIAMVFSGIRHFKH
ncbi:MAG: bifunctional phosphoribosylaminoimidazolecarboxamide formyltransferase/IMP cyclohydrolase [bacterium]|nr:bifunctional phosphoribosylaminoimidazolecarboxamide formyltransferase/IMP cyclohydrolase [bacterium]